jgi:hypothetical protein
MSLGAIGKNNQGSPDSYATEITPKAIYAEKMRTLRNDEVPPVGLGFVGIKPRKGSLALSKITDSALSVRANFEG